MYEKYGISNELISLSKQVEEELKEEFKKVDDICEYNSLKVLNAFKENKVSDMHFSSTTGYGYGDIGRDTIENIFAEILGAEDSLVRTQFVSGTHALTVALFGILRPGDTVLSINGKPYDTLDKVIGIEENGSSLKAFDINYEQIDLIDNEFDIEKIKNRIGLHGMQPLQNKIKLIIVQRSRGYSLRKSLTIEKIRKIIEEIRRINKEVYIMVDNCYGEFVETIEPTEVGADITVGSLIKNLGGGVAPNGAYIAGKKELIELCAERLTAPGLGKEAGASLRYK